MLVSGVPAELPVGDTIAGARASISFVIDGGGVVIAANQQVELPDLPFPCTIEGWTITADVAATVAVDVQRATFANHPTFASIAGTEKPSLTAATKAQDLAFSTWGSTALVMGDCLRVNVDSNNNAKRITVTLRVMRT